MGVGDAVELAACHGDELIVGGHVLLLNAFVPGGAIPNSIELKRMRVKHAAHAGFKARIEVQWGRETWGCYAMRSLTLVEVHP